MNGEESANNQNDQISSDPTSIAIEQDNENAAAAAAAAAECGGVPTEGW